MKKIFSLLVILIALPLTSGIKEAEVNEANIREISFNLKYTVKNDRGSAEHSGRMLVNNFNQVRYNEIVPQRCTFIVNNGFYQYYDYKEKKSFKSKISEMSFDHQVIVDQIFNFEIIYPLEYLKKKYFFPTDNAHEVLWGIAKNNEESRVKITFSNNRISQIDFFRNSSLTKKITFSEYYSDNNFLFPKSARIEILQEPYFVIDYSISSIKYGHKVLNSINESL